jgi:hypothetical protein
MALRLSYGNKLSNSTFAWISKEPLGKPALMKSCDALAAPHGHEDEDTVLEIRSSRLADTVRPAVRGWIRAERPNFFTAISPTPST